MLFKKDEKPLPIGCRKNFDEIYFFDDCFEYQKERTNYKDVTAIILKSFSYNVVIKTDGTSIPFSCTDECVYYLISRCPEARIASSSDH